MEEKKPNDLLILPTSVGADYLEGSDKEEYVVRNNGRKKNDTIIVRQSQIRSKATIGNISLIKKDEEKDDASHPKEEAVMLHSNRVEEKDIDDADTFDTPYSRRPTASRQKDKVINENKDDYECPLCTYMFASPCAEVFRVFKDCIDKAEESQERDDLQSCETSALNVHACSQKHGLLGYGKPNSDNKDKDKKGEKNEKQEVSFTKKVEIDGSSAETNTTLTIQKTNLTVEHSLLDEEEEDTISILSNISVKSHSSSSSRGQTRIEEQYPLSDNEEEDSDSTSTIISRSTNSTALTSVKNSSSDLISLEGRTRSLSRSDSSSSRDYDNWSMESIHRSIAEW